MRESPAFKKSFLNLSNPANLRFLEFETINGLHYDMGEPVNLSIVPDEQIEEIIVGLSQTIDHIRTMDLYLVECEQAVQHHQARIDRFREYKQWRIEHGYHP